MTYHASFEIDIVSALSDQLLAAFDELDIGALSNADIAALENKQGVYQLFHKKKLVYVGKASQLPRRLSEHLTKVLGRNSINAKDMGFKCLYVHKNWTTLAPEDSLIKHHKAKAAGLCEWNGNGFGPHDPGRERETTNKRPDGFDSQYPIRHDWPCKWAIKGTHNVLALLISLKDELPFLLRYQTDKVGSSGHYKMGHPDQVAASVTLPKDAMPADEILSRIAKTMPGWQATRFPSHIILYKEKNKYKYGTILQ